jgi:hypothetical protein
MRPTCPRCGGPHLTSVCTKSQQGEVDGAADELFRGGDVVLVYAVDDAGCPGWVPTEFRLQLSPVAGATDEEEAGARATDEGASAAGATGDRRFRQEILQWSLDTVARHQFRKRQDGGKMEQAVQASRRRMHVRRMEEWTESMGTTIPPPTGTVARINGVD